MLSEVKFDISVADVPVYSTVPVDWVNVPLLMRGREPAAPEPVRVKVLEPLAVKVWEALIESFSIFAEEARERVVVVAGTYSTKAQIVETHKSGLVPVPFTPAIIVSKSEGVQTPPACGSV